MRNDAAAKLEPVALAADDDNLKVVARRLRDAVRARRVEAPLQHRPVDHKRTWKLPLLAPLDLRTSVDQERAPTHGGECLLRGQPLHSDPRRCQHLIDSHSAIILATVETTAKEDTPASSDVLRAAALSRSGDGPGDPRHQTSSRPRIES
jgi:hypothetical protein